MASMYFWKVSGLDRPIAAGSRSVFSGMAERPFSKSCMLRDQQQQQKSPLFLAFLLLLWIFFVDEPPHTHLNWQVFFRPSFRFRAEPIARMVVIIVFVAVGEKKKKSSIRGPAENKTLPQHNPTQARGKWWQNQFKYETRNMIGSQNCYWLVLSDGFASGCWFWTNWETGKVQIVTDWFSQTVSPPDVDSEQPGNPTSWNRFLTVWIYHNPVQCTGICLKLYGTLMAGWVLQRAAVQLFYVFSYKSIYINMCKSVASHTYSIMYSA